MNINGPNGKSDSLTMYIHSDEYEKNKNIKADEPKLVVICLLLQAKERNLFIKTKKRMKKVRAAIVGYGNIGHYVLEALQAAPDFEIAGVVRRAGAENKPEELANYAVVKDIKELGEVDVAILCTPTRSVEKYAKEYLAMGINTVDSFDIHTGIVDLRRTLNATAKEHKAVSIISVGGLAHGLMTGELTGALATPLSWVPLAWPARLGSLGVEAFIDAARAAGPLLTTALAGLVLTLATAAVLIAWFCRFEDGRADA